MPRKLPTSDERCSSGSGETDDPDWRTFHHSLDPQKLIRSAYFPTVADAPLFIGGAAGQPVALIRVFGTIGPILINRNLSETLPPATFAVWSTGVALAVVSFVGARRRSRRSPRQTSRFR